MRLAAVLLAAAFCAGCQAVTQAAGDFAAQKAYNDTYDGAYKKAKAKGLSDADARAEAEKAAGKKAAKQKEIFGGIGDVASSTGEIDYASELTIGESLALEGFRRYGLPVDDPELQKYVNLVGNAVAENSARPDIPYRFVVVKSPLYNAFACPGGIVFVSSTLLASLADESELAGVLAHEVGHVAYRHALQSIRRAKFLQGAGRITAATMKGDQGKEFQSMIGDLQTVLFDKGLDQGMEYEGDRAAIETVYRTGYDPNGFLRVLAMLEKKEAGATKEGSWFSTHPPLSSRMERCRSAAAAYPDAGTLARVAERFLSFRKRL